MDVQLAVIGAGPGGYTAAIRAARRGATVCLIERGEVGGICLNWGCIPTKTLLAGAELLARIRRAGEYGLIAGEARVDLPAMLRRKDEVVKRLADGIKFLLNKHGVQVLKGAARFASPRELLVSGEGGATTVKATRIAIAAGTKAWAPPAFGYDGRQVITSDEALNLKEVPANLLIVGGGVIGCEFASLYRALGSEVTVVEMLPGLLPFLDADLGRGLAVAFKKRGIKVYLGEKVQEVRREADGVKILLASGTEAAASVLLAAIGRRTAVDGLDLAAAGLAADEGGRIPVGPDLQTSVPGIYAIGDINDRPYDLAHAASHQGLALAETLYGNGRVYEDTAIPNCVFTDPEIASVGLSEDEAARQGIPARTGKIFYRANGKALAAGESDGWVKIVAGAEDGKILGAQILGAHASDLIAEAALAVRKGLTARSLAETVHAHPTLAELVGEAAEEWTLGS